MRTANRIESPKPANTNGIKLARNRLVTWSFGATTTTLPTVSNFDRSGNVI